MKERSFFSHNVRDRRNTHTETENKREGAKRERERHPQNHFFWVQIFLKELFPSFFSPPLSDRRENNYISLFKIIYLFIKRTAHHHTKGVLLRDVNKHTHAHHIVSHLSLSLSSATTKEYQQQQKEKNTSLSLSRIIIREKKILQFLTKKHESNQRKKNSHEEEQKEY